MRNKSSGFPPVSEATVDRQQQTSVQPVKVNKTCQLGTCHSSANSVEKCQEVFAIEVLQISNFATT
jgi:hypothetical protein